VTLKVSKGRAVLPSREQRLSAKISERFCQKQRRRVSRRMAVGPLLPNGEFVSVGKLGEGLTKPRPSDWNPIATLSNLGGNWSPVYTNLDVLDTKTKRRILKNPSRKFKNSFPGGDEVLFPRRSCMVSFDRRAHALNFFRQACGLMAEVEPSAMVEPLQEILRCVPEVFRGTPSVNRAYRTMNCNLHFLLRKCRSDIRPRTNGPGEKLY